MKETAGRKPNGQFAVGNPGGPGNPLSRQVYTLRQAFFSALTASDVSEIVHSLIDQAKDGNVAAAKLVLEWSIGRPGVLVHLHEGEPLTDTLRSLLD